MVHLGGALRYLMPMYGGIAFFLLAIYCQFSTLKKPWLPIQRGVFILNHQKSTASFFSGERESVEGVITFMPTGCSFKSSLK
jgi:hypothetical protein